jgi:hypothetical protein
MKTTASLFKINLPQLARRKASIALAPLLLFGLVGDVGAQGSAFYYQGRLNDGTNAADGMYDLCFTVYDSSNSPGIILAGPVTNCATSVSEGLFSVTLDFGAGVFTGPSRWLELAVRTNGAAAFAPLTPRQLILPTPYAVMASSASNLLGTVSAGQLSGTVPAAQLPAGMITNNQAGVTLSGTFSGNLTNAGVLTANTVSAANFTDRNGCSVLRSGQTLPLALDLGNNWISSCHPSIVDAGPKGWNGYRYWLAISSGTYMGGSQMGQDMHVLASNDKVNFMWPMVNGVMGTNPVVSDRMVGAWSGGLMTSVADPELAFIPRNGHTNLLLVGIRDPINYSVVILGSESDDGVHWYAPGQVGSATSRIGLVYDPNAQGMPNIAGPQIVDNGSGFSWFFEYQLHLYRVDSSYALCFTNPPVDTGLNPWWHGDVKKVGNNWYTTYSYASVGGQPSPLGFAVSSTGTNNWQVITNDALPRSGLVWDSQGFYKPEFTINSTNPVRVDIYVSSAGTSASPFVDAPYWQTGFYEDIPYPQTTSNDNKQVSYALVSRVGPNGNMSTRVTGEIQSDILRATTLYLGQSIVPDPYWFDSDSYYTTGIFVDDCGNSLAFGPNARGMAPWQYEFKFEQDILVGSTNKVSYTPIRISPHVGSGDILIGDGTAANPNMSIGRNPSGSIFGFTLNAVSTAINSTGIYMGPQSGSTTRMNVLPGYPTSDQVELDFSKGNFDGNATVTIDGHNTRAIKQMNVYARTTQFGENSNNVIYATIRSNAVTANGFLISTNVLNWPAAPAACGQAFYGNSNGFIYLLTSSPANLVWTKTNLIASP